MNLRRAASPGAALHAGGSATTDDRSRGRRARARGSRRSAARPPRIRQRRTVVRGDRSGGQAVAEPQRTKASRAEPVEVAGRLDVSLAGEGSDRDRAGGGRRRGPDRCGRTAGRGAHAGRPRRRRRSARSAAKPAFIRLATDVWAPLARCGNVPYSPSHGGSVTNTSGSWATWERLPSGLRNTMRSLSRASASSSLGCSSQKHRSWTRRSSRRACARRAVTRRLVALPM